MKTNFFLVAVLLFFLVSCVNQIDSDVEPMIDGKVPITFTANIAPINTRVVENEFEVGDKMGLYATIAGSSLSDERYIDNLLLSYGNSNKLNPAHDIFYPDEENLDFYAYYPYRSNAIVSGATTLSVSVSENQSDKADFSNSDFLIAEEKAVENATAKIELDFNHMLSKYIICLDFKDENAAEEALKSNPSVLLTNFYTEANYDISSGEFSQPSGIANMIPHGEWIREDNVLKGKELLIVPQSISEQRLVLDIAGKAYTCVPKAMNLSSGYQYTFKIDTGDLNEGVLNEIKATISSWNDGEEQNAEANDLVSEIFTGSLSFNTSNIYRVYAGGTPIAEICKEYLYKKGEIDSRAIVVYPMENGVTDFQNGLVLQLLDETETVHGGKVAWDKEANELTYTPGNSSPIQCFYFNENMEIVTIQPDESLEVKINAYVLRDMRSGTLQKYPLVKIATQYWMREDLHATYYVDGTSITEITTLDGTPGYVKNSDASHYFYTGEAVETGLLTPDGWIVPNKADWEKLKVYLDDNTDALKAGVWEQLGNGKCYSGNAKSGFEMYSWGLYIEQNGISNLFNTGTATAYWLLNGQQNQLSEEESAFQFLSSLKEFKIAAGKAQDKDYFQAFSVRCIKE